MKKIILIFILFVTSCSQGLTEEEAAELVAEAVAEAVSDAVASTSTTTTLPPTTTTLPPTTTTLPPTTTTSSTTSTTTTTTTIVSTFTPPEIINYEFIEYNGMPGFLIEFYANDMRDYGPNVEYIICEKEPEPYPFNRIWDNPKQNSGCKNLWGLEQVLSSRLEVCDGVNGVSPAGEYEKNGNKVVVKMYINRPGCEQYLGWDTSRDTIYDWSQDWTVEILNEQNFEWYVVPTMISFSDKKDCGTRYIFQNDPSVFLDIEPPGPSIHYYMSNYCNSEFSQFNFKNENITNFPASSSFYKLSLIDYSFDPTQISNQTVFNAIPSLKLYP
jgi:hypothetical protein